MALLNPIPAENPGQGDAAPYVAAPVTGSNLTIQEVDGSPAGVCTTLVLPNGTLTIVGSVATYTPAGGSSSNDPYKAFRALLLHYVGYETQTSTLIDSSPFARAVSTGGVIDTFNYRFGGGSWFNSANSALYTQIGSGALTGMNPGTGDFAIETQFLYDDAASFPVVFHATGSHTGRFYLAIYPGGKRLYVQFNGADWMFSPINQLKLNAWQHIMWARISGVSYMFINGFLVAFQGDTNDYQIGTSGVAIGIGFGGNANFRMQETSMIIGAGPSASFPNPGAMYT